MMDGRGDQDESIEVLSSDGERSVMEGSEHNDSFDMSITASPEMKKVAKIHWRREAKWMKDKERMLEEIGKLGNECQQKEVECEALRNDNESLKNENNENEEKHERLLRDYHDLQTRFEESQNTSRARMEAENQRFLEKERRVSENWAAEVKRMEELVEENEAKLGKMWQKYENLQAEVDKMLREHRASLAAVCQKLEKTEAAYKELREIKNFYETKQHSMQTKIRELTDANEQYKQQLERICTSHQHVEKQLIEKEEKMKEESGKHEDELMEKTTIISKLETKIKSVEEKNAMNLVEMQRITVLQNDYKQEISKSLEEVEVLKNENSVLRERLEASDAHCNDLKSEKLVDEQEIEELKNTIVKLEEKQTTVDENAVERVELELKKKEKRKKEKRERPKQVAIPVPVPVSEDGAQKMAPRQWYDSTEGTNIFREIYNELRKLFPDTQIERHAESHDIMLVIASKARSIEFPSNFPMAPVHVNDSTVTKLMYFTSPNITAPEFPATVARRLIAEIRNA